MAARDRLYVLALSLAAVAGLWLGLPLLPLGAWAAIEVAIAGAGALARLGSA
jgi:hypothetical protein